MDTICSECGYTISVDTPGGDLLDAAIKHHQNAHKGMTLAEVRRVRLELAAKGG